MFCNVHGYEAYDEMCNWFLYSHEKREKVFTNFKKGIVWEWPTELPDDIYNLKKQKNT